MDSILQVKELCKAFSQGGKQEFFAVDHVSFELMSGEVLGIVGESGSGKSTIAKLVSRLMDATSGSILLHGKDITNVQGKELRGIYEHIQMVFQTPTGSFDPRRTLGDGIGERLRNQKVPAKQIRARVEELLQQCGLDAEFADRYPHEVSGGQCQRAAIARALESNPSILILDEVTSALDVTVQKQILELLQTLQREKGLSYLFICHNLALVQQMCDRVLVMYNGRIAEQGTPDQVICSPSTEYTKMLVESVF